MNSIMLVHTDIEQYNVSPHRIKSEIEMKEQRKIVKKIGIEI